MTVVQEKGRTLVGLLQALAGSSLLLTLGITQLAPCARVRAVEAGSRNLASRLQSLAWRAVAEGREVGLVFPESRVDEPLREAADDDGDGLSRDDIRAGRDGVGALLTLGADTPGVRVGRPPWPGIPEIPPGDGTIDPDDGAVRFGRARMATFDAEGHATPGSVFVTDGAQALCAVVVAGATARVRTWCLDRSRGAWQRR